MLDRSPQAQKMATAVVESQPRYTMFDKAMNAIQRCGEVAKEKLLLDYDASEFTIKLQVTIEEYWVPIYIEEKKPTSKNRRRKPKMPQRTNQLVPKSEENQVVSTSQSRLQIQIPGEHTVNVWLIYFKTLEHKVRDAVESATTDLTKSNLLVLDDIRQNLAALLGAMEKLNYAEKMIEENPSLQKILDSANKLQDLLKMLEDAQIPEILKGTVKPSKNHYLASILGIDESLVEYLSTCDDYLTREQWILRFIESRQDLQHEDFELGTPSKEQQFQSLGFTPVKAAALSNLVRNNPTFAHLTSEQWATKYIELQFKYNILLAGSRVYPHLDVNVDVEYEIKTDVDDDEEPVHMKAITKFILTREELTQDPYFADYLVQPRQPIESVKYWFHGTDIKSAENISMTGISVDQGRKKLDFSDGSGFYMTR